MISPPPPHILAQFDQMWSQINETLDEVIRVYGCALDMSPDVPREGAIVTYTHFIQDQTSHLSCAELLVCAIERLMKERACTC